MTTIEEIERAIEQLPAEEFARLKAWIALRENQQWDRRLDEDAAAGKLDFLFNEAEQERETLRDWPPA
jgi:uncharacterized protein YicC (UPF0701 family)